MQALAGRGAHVLSVALFITIMGGWGSIAAWALAALGLSLLAAGKSRRPALAGLAALAVCVAIGFAASAESTLEYATAVFAPAFAAVALLGASERRRHWSTLLAASGFLLFYLLSSHVFTTGQSLGPGESLLLLFLASAVLIAYALVRRDTRAPW